MNVIKTDIPDIKIIEPKIFTDERGSFFESWNQREFDNQIEPIDFVQDNHSISHRGVIRGLHYQKDPHAQGKLVRVLNGSVFDVAVDIRENSKYFGKHVCVLLSASNKRMLWIPPGFAHGFLALEDNTHFAYKTSSLYDKGSEASLNFKDPNLGIQWPKNFKFIINEKDSLAPNLDNLIELKQ